MTTARKIVAAIGVAVLGLVVVAATWIASLFFLPGEAACLRDAMVAGRPSHTRIQLNLGRVSTSLARLVALHTPAADQPDARQALDSVRAAAVGVYKVESDTHAAFDPVGIDATMARRGWQRFLFVREHGKTVLGYTRAGPSEGSEFPICLAVRDLNQVVVVWARVDGARLAELAASHLPPLKLVPAGA